jgi:hypothetical protein
MTTDTFLHNLNISSASRAVSVGKISELFRQRISSRQFSIFPMFQYASIPDRA